jgi:hypothetical protein
VFTYQAKLSKSRCQQEATFRIDPIEHVGYLPRYGVCLVIWRRSHVTTLKIEAIVPL